ncbi:hypothetical protein TNCV_1455781 [Trichonephila clavipes]|nr:hypothetical protein TNCV_1455781 [Trichonephila clavipes]
MIKLEEKLKQLQAKHNQGEHSGDRQRPPTSLPLPPTTQTKGLVARWLFRVPPCRKGTIYLQTSMSSPGCEPRPSGTAVNVTNRYTELTTLLICDRD